MSAAIDALFTQAELVSQSAGHGRTFLILSGPLAGQSFLGSVITQTLFDPGSPLGADPREAWMLEVILPGPALSLNHRIQDGSDIWKIVKIQAPSYVTRSYEIVKVEAVDQ